MRVLRGNEGALGWKISDLKGISLAHCMHKVHMEAEYKSVVQPQRRLNLKMKEVFLSYGGTTVVANEKNELVPTRTVTGWRMCID